ncbi:MAG TPA: sulfatase [Candidatus Binatia bacterium]|nr:sulfatase [Candidatus Binatia bacterium]
MQRRFLDLAVAALTLAVLQAVIETLVIAALHRELLLAPYRFFTVQIWDAFVKLYFAAAEYVPLPVMLGHFRGQGIGSKLSIAPELMAIGCIGGIALAVLLTPLAGMLGIGKARDRRGSLHRALLTIALAALVVHLVAFLVGFRLPENTAVGNVARAVARAAVGDGLALAIGVLGVSTAAALAVLSRGMARPVVAAGLIVAVLAPLWDTPASAVKGGEPATPPSSLARGYNVIVISIDSLRADHLSAYGYERPTSPTMEAMAARGVLFENCSSTTSWTLPSHMSLLTGRSLLGHGVVADDRALSDSVPTLAESFADAGYATHAIVSAPYVNSRYGFARGFDEYDDKTIYFATNEDSYRSVTAPQLQAAATKWLDANASKPFFLFLHYWDVHYDYAPGPPYDTMFDPDYRGSVTGENFYFDNKIRADMDPRDLQHLIALYDGEIRLVDDHLARLRADLARLGVADRTLIVVTADHGDEFFEHGNKGHHRTLHEEVIAVPLVIEAPGIEPAQRRVAGETSIIDVAPTVLSLTGLAAPAGMEGRDLSQAFLATPGEPHQGAVYAELYRKGTLNIQVAQIQNRSKLIHHFNNRALLAYDLRSDPAEKTQLDPTGEAVTPQVSALRDWLDGRWRLFDRRVRSEGIAEVVIDEKTAETLRSLGYLN